MNFKHDTMVTPDVEGGGSEGQNIQGTNCVGLGV